MSSEWIIGIIGCIGITITLTYIFWKTYRMGVARKCSKILKDIYGREEEPMSIRQLQEYHDDLKHYRDNYCSENADGYAADEYDGHGGAYQ